MLCVDISVMSCHDVNMSICNSALCDPASYLASPFYQHHHVYSNIISPSLKKRKEKKKLFNDLVELAFSDRCHRLTSAMSGRRCQRADCSDCASDNRTPAM